MVKPFVSVCIANYNGEHVVLPCIESVLRQQCSEVVEIIVHDDASTDGSADLLAACYPAVTLIRSPANVGFCVSNNRMAEVARGKYVLLLNNDAVLHDGALQKMLEVAEVGNGFGGILSLAQYQLGTGRLLDRGCRMDPSLNLIPVLGNSDRRIAVVMGACLWIPRELWMQIGGFPEWLESIGEDIFLCLAAWQARVGVRAIAAGGYDHAVGFSFGGGKVVQGGLKTTYRRRFLSERNRTCVLIVFCPTLLMPGMLLLHIGTMMIEGLVMTLVKRDVKVMLNIYCAALGSALSLWRTVLSERSRLKALFGPFSMRDWLRLVSPIPQKLRVVLRHGIPDVR